VPSPPSLRVAAASWNGHPQGARVNVDAAQAASLIRLGVLEPIPEKRKKTKE
jgi:hypothetical protein